MLLCNREKKTSTKTTTTTTIIIIIIIISRIHGLVKVAKNKVKLIVKIFSK